VGLVALTFVSEQVRAMKLKFRPTPGTAPWYDREKTKKPSWEKPDWPVNYFVPNFGDDIDIVAARKNINDTEKRLKTTLHADFGQTDGVKRDYFVPNFGQD